MATIVLDMQDRKAVADVLSKVPESLKKIDILVNNAGKDIIHPTRIPFSNFYMPLVGPDGTACARTSASAEPAWRGERRPSASSA